MGLPLPLLAGRSRSVSHSASRDANLADIELADEHGKMMRAAASPKSSPKTGSGKVGGRRSKRAPSPEPAPRLPLSPEALAPPGSPEFPTGEDPRARNSGSWGADPPFFSSPTLGEAEASGARGLASASNRVEFDLATPHSSNASSRRAPRVSHAAKGPLEFLALAPGYQAAPPSIIPVLKGKGGRASPFAKAVRAGEALEAKELKGLKVEAKREAAAEVKELKARMAEAKKEEATEAKGVKAQMAEAKNEEARQSKADAMAAKAETRAAKAAVSLAKAEAKAAAKAEAKAARGTESDAMMAAAEAQAMRAAAAAEQARAMLEATEQTKGARISARMEAKQAKAEAKEEAKQLKAEAKEEAKQLKAEAKETKAAKAALAKVVKHTAKSDRPVFEPHG